MTTLTPWEIVAIEASLEKNNDLHSRCKSELLAKLANATTLTINRPVPVELARVSSVYSGINGRCCCGCSGKHTYASAHQEWASKNRGYEVTDDEVSDRSVKIIVNKINKRIAEGDFEYYEDTFVSVVVGQRLYIAYFVTEEK